MTKLIQKFKYTAWITKNIGLGSAVHLLWLKLAGRTRPVRLTWKGTALTVRSNTPDLDVAISTLGPEFKPLEGVLDPDFDGLIVDAGGYIGTAALALSRLFPQAQVVTIEPSSENLEILRANISDSANIDVIPAALTATPGRVTLSNRGTGQWGYTIIGADQSGATDEIEDVETITLEEIQARYADRPVGLIKMDIEGGEKVLLDNPGPVLSGVPALFIELHDRILPGCEAAFTAFAEGRTHQNFGGEKYLSLRRPEAGSAGAIS